MNKDKLELIKKLTATDSKNLTQKALKSCEEVGELAKWVLPFENAFATTHRFADKEKILEEAVDGLLCLYSVAYDIGMTDEDIDAMAKRKIAKWAELQSRERNAKYPVPFEFHVTVKTNELERFKSTCLVLSVKPIILDLQNQAGDSVMQDVMTSSSFLGTNPEALEEMEKVAQGLYSAGFEVIRKKIETVPWHPAAPSDEHAHPVMPKDCYFECHFNVLCSDKVRDRLQGIAIAYNAHLSRNIFKKVDADNYKIMITARVYEGTREDFQVYVDDIETALNGADFQIDKIITEFSIYDTKISHDSSWLKK